MTPTRLMIGLSVGSGGGAVEAAAVRIDGAGHVLTARPEASARTTVAGPLREALAAAARQVVGKADLRSALAIGLVAPSTADDALAEATGLTVVGGFRGRDVAAGGSGQLLTAVADAKLYGHPVRERVLVHLGSVTSVLLIPPGGKLSGLIGFEAGPGTSLLDRITALGTRGREPFDPGGTKAVQGRCLDELLARWLADPFLGLRPPKAVPTSAFDEAFLTDAFAATRSAGGTLNDLLCTATQFVARSVGVGCERWLPPAAGREVYVSGGGTRNGFLSMQLEGQFPGRRVGRLDDLGVPATGRSAAAAAVLAALTLDGVAANLPQVTGAAGRLVGRLTPGDGRNWAACCRWMAEQMADYTAVNRAA